MSQVCDPRAANGICPYPQPLICHASCQDYEPLTMRFKPPPHRFVWPCGASLLIPAAAWALVKPVRVVAPSWAGVSCPSQGVHRDASRLADAQALHAEAVEFVGRNLAPIAGVPRVIFCASDACAESFGLGERSAVTVATVATVIEPRAWQAPTCGTNSSIRCRRSNLPWSASCQADLVHRRHGLLLSRDPRALRRAAAKNRQRFDAWFPVLGGPIFG